MSELVDYSDIDAFFGIIANASDSQTSKQSAQSTNTSKQPPNRSFKQSRIQFNKQSDVIVLDDDDAPALNQSDNQTVNQQSVHSIFSQSNKRKSVKQSNNQSSSLSTGESASHSSSQTCDSSLIDRLTASSRYYDVETMRDFDQAIDQSDNQSATVKPLKRTDDSTNKKQKLYNPAYHQMQNKQSSNETANQATDPSLQAPDSRPGWVLLPTFALVDEGVHGPMQSDHMQHKLHYDGYWEQRMNKLQSQLPVSGIYETLSTFKQPTEQSNSQSTEQSSTDGRLPQIFRDTCFYFNGRTAGSDELSAPALTPLIRLHGGQVTPALSRTHVTHIVAANLNRSKFESEFAQRWGGTKHRARASSPGLVVVKPEFIKDCIQAGRLIDTKPYELIKDLTQATLSFGQVAAGAT